MEVVDEAVGQIVEVGLFNNFSIFVFADHGNAEDQSEKWRTSHTTNPVSFIFVSKDDKKISLEKGMGLRDIAPTVLYLMGIKKPQVMDGKSIIKCKAKNEK